MGPLKTTMAIFLIVTMAFFAIAAQGQWRWLGLTRALMDRLESARVMPDPVRFDTRELQGLPPVVQRYFRAVLRDGVPMVAAASVGHELKSSMPRMEFL